MSQAIMALTCANLSRLLAGCPQMEKKLCEESLPPQQISGGNAPHHPGQKKRRDHDPDPHQRRQGVSREEVGFRSQRKVVVLTQPL